MSADMIRTGSVVIPVNGRFAGRLMVVIGIRDGYADVCDGKRRSVAKPKRKKLCHLSLLSPPDKRLTVDAELTNGKVRKYISAYRTETGFPDKMKHDSIQ